MSSQPPTYTDDETRPERFVAVVETYDAEPDECTIHPDRADDRLLTEWISAADGSFVALADMR